jgi:hypothetical protein
MPLSTEIQNKPVHELRGTMSDIIDSVANYIYYVIINRYNKPIAAIVAIDEIEWMVKLEQQLESMHPELFQSLRNAHLKQRIDQKQKQEEVERLRLLLKETRDRLKELE